MCHGCLGFWGLGRGDRQCYARIPAPDRARNPDRASYRVTMTCAHGIPANMSHGRSVAGISGMPVVSCVA